VFTSLPDNHSELGLRWLADEIAQSRPGPMMMHILNEDPRGAELEAGYGFLYNVEPQEPPPSNALVIYCQPYLTGAARIAATGLPGGDGGITRDTLLSLFQSAQEESIARSIVSSLPVSRAPIARNVRQELAAALPLESSPLDPFFGAENVPPVVASTER